ncbi:MAG: cytochrome P460 family protein [Deltaproteobacteria bacterium]|nr:cytochrome P460 family protein [Deltaproteobacteria bacterium]
MTRFAAVLVLAACGATSPAAPASVASAQRSAAPPPAGDLESQMMGAAAAMGGDAESRFGPLEVGADYLTYRKLTPEPFLSKVHGNRWVDVYVNEVGADAYLNNGEIPDGTIVVKTSWQDDDGAPSRVAGPIYIMQKRPVATSPEHDGWYFAIHWADPPPEDRKRFGGPIYWRGSSPRAAFCWECHDSYDRSLGGLVPSSVLPR